MNPEEKRAWVMEEMMARVRLSLWTGEADQERFRQWMLEAPEAWIDGMWKILRKE